MIARHIVNTIVSLNLSISLSEHDVFRSINLNLIHVNLSQDKYIAPLVVQMLQMMTDLEDEEDWAVEDEVEDVDSDVSLYLAF